MANSQLEGSLSDLGPWSKPDLCSDKDQCAGGQVKLLAGGQIICEPGLCSNYPFNHSLVVQYEGGL